MKKMLTVLVNEIKTVLSSVSFWLGALGMPLIAAAVFGVIGWINQGSDAAQGLTQIFTMPADAVTMEGYVDPGGYITEVEGLVPPGMFAAYEDEEAALQALETGEISAYYIVPADYLESGTITYVRPDFNPLAIEGSQSSLFTWLLQVNLLEGDVQKAALVGGPLEVEEVLLTPEATAVTEMSMAYWVPYAVTLIFYILIISTSSLLLSNIAKEKENRIMEVLLTSVTPRQMLSGKILGLGIVGLLQTLIWLGTTSLLLNRSQGTFQLESAFTLPVSFVIWGIVFFLLGYAVYASLMAGLGALAPNLREASQATFVVMLPLMIPMILGNTVFGRTPHGSLATFLSIFPLTSPVAMTARLAVGGVAWWQPWAAVLLLAGTVALIIRAVAGMFRAQALLSGQEFNVKKYFRALLGRA